MATSSRRQFVAAASTVIAALVLPRERVFALGAVRRRTPIPHPTPRPGITAAKMLTRVQLAGSPKLIPLFDAVRAIPEIIDGIRCNCGCADLPDFYSLLSCYEGTEAMALSCSICQGQGRLAARLHAEGKTLDQIRIAVDAKFG